MLMVEEEERFQKYADYIAGEKAHIRAIGEKQRKSRIRRILRRKSVKQFK